MKSLCWLCARLCFLRTELSGASGLSLTGGCCCAQGAAKGLTTVALPETVLLGIDMTGVQLFDGRTRALIDGEGYPYHLIRSWSWHQVRLFPSRFL